jgi:hypothetical protein
MNAKHSEKSTGPRGYNKVMPGSARNPGHRDQGSHGSGQQGRTPSTEGRGSFSGSPVGMSGGCDWGSPHKTTRHPSTGRGK